MNIVIFEDNLTYCQNFSAKIERFIERHDSGSEIVICTREEKRIKKYIENCIEISLFFLDICIGKNNEPLGLKLADEIKKNNNNHIIVFITNYPETIYYNITAKLNSLAYISKSSPVFDEELETILFTSFNLHKKKSLVIKNKYCLINSIPYKKIYSIEKIKGTHKIAVYHDDGYIESYDSIKKVISGLSMDFFMCNRSCIVNMSKIIQIDKKNRTVTTSNNRKIGISFDKLGDLVDAYNKFLTFLSYD